MLRNRAKTQKIKKRSVEVLLQGGFGNQLFQLMYVLKEYPDSNICLNAQILRPRINHEGFPEVILTTLPKNVYVKYGPRKFFSRLFNLNTVIRIIVKRYINTAGVQNKIINPRAIPAIIRFLLSLYAGKCVNLDAEGNKRLGSRDTFVIGYFQSEPKTSQLDILSIRNILKIIDKTVDSNLKVSPTMNNKVLGVHIRRGDYAQNENFGILGIGYYSRSLNLIEHKFQIDRVWIFVEEELQDQAVIELFSSDYPVEIITKQDIPSELATLQKMAECDVFISANSTFSWWGANLIFNQQNVFAPIPWFKSNPNFEPPIPESWNKVEAEF
jgi:hypothetical protein